MSREGSSRRWLLLAAAAALTILAAWWASLGDPPPPKIRTVEFPQRMRPEEEARAERRRTIAVAESPPVPAAQGPRPVAAPRAPLLRALAAPEGQPAVVFEANALRHSPIGERIVECFLRKSHGELDQFRDESGIDLLEDIDRIALDGRNVLVTGNFGKARWDKAEEEGAQVRSYGDSGRILSVGDRSIAVWRDEMIAFSPGGAADLEATIDRIEGRAPAAPALAEGDSFGDAYGRIPVEGLVELLGADQPALAEKLRAAAKSVDLHVDATHDLAFTIDVPGAASPEMTDLADAVSGAIGLARLQAKASGQDELAELLGFAGVRRGDGGFSLDLAVPLELMERHLGAICPPEEDAPTAAEGP